MFVSGWIADSRNGMHRQQARGSVCKIQLYSEQEFNINLDELKSRTRLRTTNLSDKKGERDANNKQKPTLTVQLCFGRHDCVISQLTRSSGIRELEKRSGRNFNPSACWEASGAKFHARDVHSPRLLERGRPIIASALRSNQSLVRPWPTNELARQH